MISPEARKLAIFIQTHQFKRELDNLKQQGYRIPQSDTCTGRQAYTALMDLITNFNVNDSNRK